MNNLVRDVEIKLVDDAHRTVLSFVKRGYCDGGVWTWDDWGVAVKPRSQKMLMHNRRQPTLTPARYLKQLPDGRRVLQLSGLTLRWEKVTPELDRLVEHNVPTLTIDQLRDCIRYRRDGQAAGQRSAATNRSSQSMVSMSRMRGVFGYAPLAAVHRF